MILKRLRMETREAHDAVEHLLPFRSGELARERYGEVLAGFRGFYRTWEGEALRNEMPALASVVAERSKLHLIDADLAWFGVNAAGLQADLDPAQLPDLRRAPSLLGSMYVVEGSTLGGQVISRELEQRLGFRNGEGYSFFRSYGASVGQRWKAFCGMLEAAPESEADEIVAAAQQTFAAFLFWFQQRAHQRDTAAWTR